MSLLLSVMVSEEIQTYFLNFTHRRWKSDLNTVCTSYFQAELENNTKQNSILILENCLLNTDLGHQFCMSK